MNRPSLVFYTSTFRPQMERDMGTELIDLFLAKGYRVSMVIGPDEEKLRSDCHQRGIPYHTALPEFRIPSLRLQNRLKTEAELAARLESWLMPVKNLKPDLGVLYFSTWIPPEMIQIPKNGFLNFHPAPLPQLRGFLPEDFALLWGWKKMKGTVHVVTPVIDEGPILAYSSPADLSVWDTPDSVMQKVGETAGPAILKGLKKLLEGKPGTKQDLSQGFDASYEAFYPESFINWNSDDHKMIRRRFQVFRGQNHRVVLKAKILGEVIEILDMQLVKKKNLLQLPGEVLSRGPRQELRVRTLEGYMVITRWIPFIKNPKLAPWLDHDNLEVIPPGRPGKS